MLMVVKFRYLRHLIERWSYTVVPLGAIAALGVAMALYANFGFGILASISTDSMEVHADFDTFWRSAEALWEGRDIYDTGAELANLNPPFWTVLISPLGLLKPVTAYHLFVILSLLVTISYLAWTASELDLQAGWVLGGGSALLLSSPMLSTLALGQIYSLLALGLVAAWVADRRDRSVLSGVALGLVVAVKPLLAPVVLWPLVSRKWQAFAATLIAGTAVTLVGVIVAGAGTTLDWIRYTSRLRADGFWDNNTIPGAASRIFTENDYVEPIASVPWALPVAYALGIGGVILTAVVARRDPEMGLWALVAASLLASPIAWHNYLVLLGPAVLLLLARGWVASGCLLLALQLIPPDWSAPWRHGEAPWAPLALTFYLYILVVYWLTLLVASERKQPTVQDHSPGLTLH
jgi:alpha-1,2-mannosyltransferase/arabinofuranan 3-O-arabinosyltransferase